MIRLPLALGLQDHGATGAAQDAEHPFDLGEMLGHHILDSSGYYELPGLPVPLPAWLTKHTVLMLAAAVITTIAMVVVARTVSRAGPGKAPSGFANAVEAMVVFFRDDICKANIGEGYQRFTPFILTLFFFILAMNLLGLVPWGGTATANVSVTAALAAITFLVTEVSGFRKLGPSGYMKTIFFAPPGMHGFGKAAILCLMTPIELLGKLTQPFALAVRLFANMVAGHMLIFSLLGLIVVFYEMFPDNLVVVGGVTAASFGMVSAILLMELLIAVIQAYVFALLSSVFIGLMQHEH